MDIASLRAKARFQHRAGRNASEEARVAELSGQKMLPLTAETESGFEDWADDVANCLAPFKPSLESTMAAIQQACRHSPVDERLWGDVIEGNHEDVESGLNAFAKEKYAGSRYFRELEVRFVTPARQQSVGQAAIHLEKTWQRYIRVAERHGKEPLLTAGAMLEIAYDAIPQRVLLEVKKAKPATYAELMRVAKEVEAVLGVDAHQVYTADLPGRGERMEDGRWAGSPDRMAKAMCYACGEMGHFASQCRFAKERCENCEMSGHIAKACRNMVTRVGGRVTQVVIVRPGSTNVKTKIDRTTTDHMNTLGGTVKSIKGHFDKKSSQRKEYAEAKKQAGPSDKKVKKEAEVRQVHYSEEASSSSEAEGFYAEDKCLAEPTNVLAFGTFDNLGREDLSTTLLVEGKLVKALPDTGASRSLMCSAVAAELGIGVPADSSAVLLRGVSGMCKGRLSNEVSVSFGKKQCRAKFIVVDTGVPVLIGRDLLKSLGMLRVSEVGATLAYPIYNVVDESEAVNLKDRDTVSGIDESKSDAQLELEQQQVVMDLISHLSPRARARVWDLFVRNKDCWLRPGVGRVNYKANFVVQGKPVKHKLRYVAPELKQELEKQLDSQLKKGVIRPSKSPYGARPIFLKKKTGEWRIVLDYRDVNKQMVSDAYPIPLLWGNLQEAAGYSWYVTLDANWGFWNVPLEEECKPFTAFVTHRGTFEFNVIPFGIKNSPGEFQRAMDQAFTGMIGDHMNCYIDDIVIWGNTFDEVLVLLEKVLQRCCESGLFLKLSKSELFRSEVKLLGHVVGLKGIKPQESKVEALDRMGPPKDKSELRSLLGTASFHRRFVPNFASVVTPWTELMAKNAAFGWGPSQVEALEVVKAALKESCYLQAPTDEDPFVLATDASGTGIGATLMQLRGDQLVVLEYGSRKLTAVERRWDVRERELFAVKFFISKWECYLITRHFVVLTDHKNLQYLNTQVVGKVARWSLYLQQFDFAVMYIEGDNNYIADWLSRCELDPDEDRDLEVMAMCGEVGGHVGEEGGVKVFVALPGIDDLQCEDNEVPEEERKFVMRRKDGILVHVRTGRVYIPVKRRLEIFQWFHLGDGGLHCGINKTVKRVAAVAWWPCIHVDVAKWAKQCLVCQRTKAPVAVNVRAKSRGSLSKPVAFDLVSVDVVGPRTVWGRTYYVLVILDHATRFMVTAVSLTNDSYSHKCAFERSWVACFGVPRAVLSDRGREFEGSFVQYLTELKVKILRTSAYYPQGNGMNESSHRALMAAVGAGLQEGLKDYASVVASATRVYNSCVHGALGVSPFSAMFGREPMLPGWQDMTVVDSEEKRMAVLSALEDDRMMRATLKALGSEPRKIADNFATGDVVVYKLPSNAPALSQEDSSLDRAFHGRYSFPMVVVAVSGHQLQLRRYGGGPATIVVSMTQVRKFDNSPPGALGEVYRKFLRVNKLVMSCGCERGRCVCVAEIPGPSKRVRTLKSGEGRAEQRDPEPTAPESGGGVV